MAIIRNNSKATPFGFPGTEVVIAPGQSAEIENWEDLKLHPMYRSLVKEGTLEVEKASRQSDRSTPDFQEKDK